MFRCCAIVLVVLLVTFLTSSVQANVFNMPTGLTSLETVPVGDPGNAGEWSGQSYGGYGPDRVCGAVGYDYRIAKYEVTAGQYTEFLNAVAKNDTYGLYDANMWSSPFGCKIQQSGSSANYTYSVTSDYANRPVNFVNYYDACRFANWLHNNQPTGAEGAGTTETGAYTMTSDGIANNTIVRNADWKWAVTSEDEWYKAAYYKGGGVNAGYWDYATRSNAAPGQNMADASGNNANYQTAPNAWPIDSGEYYTTVAGEFQNSHSSYGTFDQTGNVYEWTETILTDGRILRGGGFANPEQYQRASWRDSYSWWGSDSNFGFRVVGVPEPGSLTMLFAGTIGLLGYASWRRRVRAT